MANVEGMTAGMTATMMVIVPVGPVAISAAVVITMTTVVAVASLAVVAVPPWQGALRCDLNRHVAGGLLGHVI